MDATLPSQLYAGLQQQQQQQQQRYCKHWPQCCMQRFRARAGTQ